MVVEMDKERMKIDLPIAQYTLSNGLRVVLSEDYTVPIVSIALLYDVGSRNERRGRGGLAHLFEHMMFEGSENVGKFEHHRLITKVGGTVNGFTNKDMTAYFETLPSNYLALGLWLEADRMRSLALTKENFENQRAVVIEERRYRVDNEAYFPAWLRLKELAYENWAYGHSIIGSMEDLKNITFEDAKEFLKKYYSPCNAVLVITGDFEQKKALNLIQKYFGNIPCLSPPQPPTIKEPPQTAPKYETIKDPNATLPAFIIAYHIPELRHKDYYPLDILADILGGGRSSILYQKLVKQGLAQEIEVMPHGLRGPSLFVFWAILTGKKSASSVREIIFSEIKKIASEGISADELKKAHNRIKASFIFRLQQNLHKAILLGRYTLYWKDPTLIRTELQHYLKVSSEDIKRVAKKYFEQKNQTLIDIFPIKKESKNEPKS
jgi:predicted Zn-dependent peptidase